MSTTVATAAPADDDGAPKQPTVEDLRRRLEYAELTQKVQLLESCLWGDDFGGSDLVERAIRERYGDGEWVAIVNFIGDRREGRKWPIWTSLNQLNIIRGRARLLFETNPYAEGHVTRLVDYIIGKGYVYRFQPKKPRAVPGQQPTKVPDDVKKLMQQSQDWLDRWVSLNRWTSMAMPAEELTTIGATREEEAVQRVFVDGETTLRLHALDDSGGQSLVRFIEAVHIVDPPGATTREGWSLGIKHRITPFVDVETIEAIYVRYVDDAEQQKGDGEEVPGSEIVRILPRKENLVVKRGTPMLSGGTADAHERALKLQSNASKSAAYKAATAEIWVHETGTRDEISTLSQSLGETRTGHDGRAHTDERLRAPGIRRMPKGVTPQNTTAVGFEEFLGVGQGDLRMAGSPTASPEYLISGDASNANYASTKEAGAPFVVSTSVLQDHFKAAFLLVIRKAMRIAIDAGALPEEALTLLELQIEGHKDDTRSPLERAQEDDILVNDKIKSRKTCQLERNLDPEIEDQNIEEDEAKFGPMAGGGSSDPFDDLIGGQGGGNPRRPAPRPRMPTTQESLLEDFDEGKHPRDHGKFARAAGAMSALHEAGKAASKAAAGLEHAGKAFIDRQVAKLPGPLQHVARGAWHAVMAGHDAAQAAVAAVAKAKGLSDEQTATLTRWTAAVNWIIGGKLLPMAAAASGAGPLGTTVSGFTPVGSAAYLAFAASTDPRAVWMAARTAVQKRIASHRVTAQESEAQASGILHVLADHASRPNFDSWMACYLAALDETEGDLEQSAALAEEIAGGPYLRE